MSRTGPAPGEGVREWGGGGELKQGEILATKAISQNRREVSEAVSEFNS